MTTVGTTGVIQGDKDFGKLFILFFARDMEPSLFEAPAWDERWQRMNSSQFLGFTGFRVKGSILFAIVSSI